MKKLFGVVGLIFCVFLVSCNFNNMSNETGNLEFSIPVNEIIQSRNQYAARNTAGGDESISGKICVYVQVRGSKGYYKTDKKEFGITAKGDYSKIQDSINNSFSFSFSDLSAKEQYTVYADFIFSEDKKQEDSNESISSYRFLTGTAENVKIKGGRSSNVDLSVSFPKKSFISIREDFNDNTSENFENNYIALKFQNQSSSTGHHMNNSNEYLSLMVQNGNLLYEDYKAINFAPKIVNDVSFVLDQKSAFATGVEYILNYTQIDPEAKKHVLKTKEIEFTNGSCSIKSFLLDNVSNDVQIQSITVKNNDISFEEYVQSPNCYESNTETKYATTGIKTGVGLTFVKDSQENRFVANISFQDLIGSETINDGDTLVFILSLNYSFENLQFYYMLSPLDRNSGAWDGNNCINFNEDPNDNYTFVMPLNAVIPKNFQGNDRTLKLFFDQTPEGDQTQINITGNIKYYLFPSEQCIYAFKVGKSWENEGELRYEMEESLGPNVTTISQHDVVTVDLSGYGQTISFNMDDKPGTVSLNPTITLTGEIFDSSWTPFQGLSNSTAPNAKLAIPVPFGSDSFVFDDISDMATVDVGISTNPTFMFQCTGSCSSSQSLLLIKNFNISAYKE